MEACINEALGATTELEEGLRNGVYLAKLAHFMCPEHVSLKKIYDKDQTRYEVCICGVIESVDHEVNRHFDSHDSTRVN